MLRWFVDALGRAVEAALRLAAALIRGVLSAPAVGSSRAAAPIRVRPATADEVLDVRHQVLRAGRPREAAQFEGDAAPSARHWVAEQADRVVGVVSVLEAPMPGEEGLVEPRPWRRLRGMAVVPELQGEGIGAELLAATHAMGEPMWCNARIRAAVFYRRHGWVSVGDPFDVPGIGPHQRMWWRPTPR